MAAKFGWTKSPVRDGVWTYKLKSWTHYHALITSEFLELSTFCWRGQRDASWRLQSSFDRKISLTENKLRTQLASQHLSRFKLAARGRRGFAPQRIESDNDWWALAQHNGMVTPLLDWTESPFVALYFAFEAAGDQKSRAVYALGNINAKLASLKRDGLESTAAILEKIRPMQDDNARLVSQAGLFTRLPLGMTVEDWIKENFEGDTRVPRLVKIILPEEGRDQCLLSLNRMNINHLSLFPDLFGAGEHCNKALSIDKYASSERL